jgi:NitT/TauT family transport system substrate-binding protein
MKMTALKVTTTGAMLCGWMVASGFSPAAKSIEVGLQATGPAAWEIAAMQAAHIDAEHGIAVEVSEVADTAAGQAALQARQVNAILSDVIWTSNQRHGGADFAFVPHALVTGGLMVMPGGQVGSVADLAGASIGVAGGAMDPSYAVLQAHLAAQTGGVAADAIDVRFEAPPVINELLLSGEIDAALNLWEFNAQAAAGGAVELISVADMLRDLGVERTPPLLGWVFSERWARSHRDEITRFLDASYETKQLLLQDDAIWDTIRPSMGEGLSDADFAALRDGYRRGIVTSYGQADIDAAAAAFALMARYGGGGDAGEIAEGTFWEGFRADG